MPEVRKWEYDGVTCNTYGFEQSQWLKNWWNFTDYHLTAEGGHSQAPPFQGGERVTSFLQNKQQLESLQIFPLDTQLVNLAPSSEKWIVENWTLTNSFRAAYITWDESNTVGASSQQDQLEQEFDYDEFPLEQFYNLSLESTHDFQTATIQHETTITVELNKNPFNITSQTINPRAFSSLDLTFPALPSPYIAADFVSKKNYLGLSIEHEANIADRLYLYFEGTLDIAISDTTDIGEILMG